MKKAWMCFGIDLSMFGCVTILGVSGMVQRWVLPPGQGGRRGLGHETFLGLTRHEFGDLHFFIAALLVGLIAVHIILHWSWIKGRFRALRRGQTDEEACGPSS
jgi:hypothetical protein